MTEVSLPGLWSFFVISFDLSICPKAAAAITAVSKASDARITALRTYLLEAGRQAALETAAAKRALASLQPLEDDLATDKSDLAQEQLGVNGQIAALAESAQRRPAFSGAEDSLRQIAALEQQRSQTVDSEISHGEAALAPVRDFAGQLEVREGALKEAQAAFEAESVRWRAYYTARLARAQAEGDLPTEVDPTGLARYLYAIIQGMAVQAASGASRQELERLIETSLSIWPSG